jgi:hypothetical protein
MKLGSIDLPIRRLIAAGLALAVAGAAHAFLIDAKTQPQKNRSDINLQSAKHIACLIKAVQACERKGTTVEQECFLATGTTAPGIDPEGKFPAAIAKCDSKLLFMKKAGRGVGEVEAYEALGCPGDGDTNTPGDQRFTDMIPFQESVKPVFKSTLDTLAAALPALTGCDVQPGLKLQTKCLNAERKRLTAYSSAIGKCQRACENDYVGKKGDGGPVDDPVCALDEGLVDETNESGDPTFNACVDRAFEKATRREPWPPSVQTLILPEIHAGLNSTTATLYNTAGKCF